MKASRLLALLALALSGSVVFPVAAYWAGGRVVGPYAGPRGLATFIGNIYSDAASASPWALVMVTGPVLVVAIWKLRRWALQRLLAGADQDDSGQ